MSQWGAYGAATKGLDWREILAFYYPGTKVTALPATSVRVWITADSDASLTVKAAKGLRLHEPEADRYVTLPTGSSYAEWRVRRSGSGFVLEHRAASGSWKTRSPGLAADRPWVFDSSADVVSVVLPGGAVTEYRGRVGLVASGSSARTVNTVDLESYLRGVVPAEMPTSWAKDAVRAQAVAARSYALRLRDASTATGYDLCDTTACQVYKGAATTSGGRRTVHETSGGDDAVRATARHVVTSGGRAALTQFSASNGGQTVRGDHPYLTARKDPYDGVVADQSWTRTLTSAELTRQWPAVGTVVQLRVAQRDGQGSWGGRVQKIEVIGTKGRTTVSGDTFRGRFGLRSSYFTVSASARWRTFPRTQQVTQRVTVASIDSRGRLLSHPVTGATTLGSPTTVLADTSRYRQLTAVGDWDGDGVQDLAGLTTAGRLELLRGKPLGGYAAPTQLGGSASRRAVAGVGDLSGDGRPDLLVITGGGNLWLKTGDGKGGTAGDRRIRTGWSRHTELHGVGDVDGDGRVDVVVRSGSTLYLCRGTATGLAPGQKIPGGWATYTLQGPGDLTGDGRVDLVSRTKDGVWQVRPGTGTGSGFGSPKTLRGSGLGVLPLA
nr:SpoIID/LytB domain-containing protein [Auraticoccus cholistanensis]